jgi:hypothetical protein
MLRATYLSSDELERAEAFEAGYRTVIQHPREVRDLVGVRRLVIDLDHVLFDDKDDAIKLAREATAWGLWVGIHTYYPDDPRLDPLRGWPNVVVRKTHRRVRQALRRKVRRSHSGKSNQHKATPKKATEVIPVTPAKPDSVSRDGDGNA